MRSLAVIIVLIANTFSVESHNQNRNTNPSGILVNSIFDFISESIKTNVNELQNYTTVPIPDFVKKFQVNLGIKKMTASITATNGTLSDLTTLHRVGDVTMSTENGTVYFNAAVALNPLRVVFRKYTLQASFIHKSGNLLALDVRKNSFNAIFTARFEKLKCQLVLEKIKIKELADVKVNLTGFSILNPIGKKLVEWFIYYFNNYTLKITETYAKEIVNYIIRNSDICNKFYKSGLHGLVNTRNGKTSHYKPSNLGNRLLENDHPLVNPLPETYPRTHFITPSEISQQKEKEQIIPEKEENISLLDFFEESDQL